jgi:hypothetical protein
VAAGLQKFPDVRGQIEIVFDHQQLHEKHPWQRVR